ncbi:MAG: dipeptide epimerase [Ignavibacteriales bacterium CG07_land_8_20_14_0_80_59_12]|nr:MAG: dipeptide epimerase [Ignavibacteriales bacterium CG07_land_8_20_14_0_80_59_12]
MGISRRNFLSAAVTTGVGAAFMKRIPQIFPHTNAKEAAVSGIKLTYRRYELKLRHVFTISRSSKTVTPVIFADVTADGITGTGESSPNARYHEDASTVTAFLDRIDLSRYDDPFEREDILDYVAGIAPENTSAKAAVDIALHDWAGKKLGVPLYKLWGLDRNKVPVTSFTIAIDTPKVMQDKIREAEEYPIYKIKVGLDNDAEIMKAVREVTKKTLRVDANEGWKTKEVALERIKMLQDNGVEFIEQPMPAAQLSDIAWLKERVGIPIMADESVLSLYDIPKIAEAFDGINIKLMKSTGIREAMRMIHTARAFKMKIMLGCMIESSVGISAAAHLSPLVDYTDLDGNLLITNDPYTGLTLKDGRVIPGDGPGLGVVPREG